MTQIMYPSYIETDGVLALRPMTLEDSQLIVDWRNNPRVQSRYIYREPFTLEGQKRYYHAKVETGETAQFIACEIVSGQYDRTRKSRDIDADGTAARKGPMDAGRTQAQPCGTQRLRPIGCVVLDDIHPQYAECGNWIGEDDAIGKGYSPRMIRLACLWGFRELGLDDIVARIFTDNPASIRSYERAGFRTVGFLPEVECSDGSRKDMLFLRMKRPAAGS